MTDNEAAVIIMSMTSEVDGLTPCAGLRNGARNVSREQRKVLPETLNAPVKRTRFQSMIGNKRTSREIDADHHSVEEKQIDLKL